MLSSLFSRFGHTQVEKKRLAFLIILLFSLLYALLLPNLGIMQEFEYRMWDWRARLSVVPGKADKNVRIIEVTQASLDAREKDGITWPWPRAMYAAVIRFLEQAGAKGVAFDILFTEGSSWGPNDDKDFEEAIKGPLPVVLAAVLTDAVQYVDEQELKVFVAGQQRENQRSAFERIYLDYPKLANYRSVALPILQLLSAADAIGNVNAAPDSDGVFRHFAPGGTVNGTPVLNLPFALYNLVHDLSDDRSFALREYIDGEGRLAVHFQEAQGSYDPVDIDAVLNSVVQLQSGEQPQLDPASFKDKWVFVGVSAPGLLDLRPTPLDEKYKGVEYNATVFDNLINDDFVRKTSPLHNLLYTMMFAGLAAGGLLFIPNLLGQAFTLILALVSQLAIAYFLALNGYWILLAIPLSCTVISMLLALGVQYQLEGRQHKFIKDAFKFYVSPSVIDQIVINPQMLSLGGEKRELSIFFSDIAGFTSISERLEANKLVQLLNVFLTEMTTVILQDEGTVDKYVGDAIVAFWNAPLIVSDHAYKAVRAALHCQEKIRELQPILERDFGVTVNMRIGLNTGVVSVGNFGSKDRFNYTVVGDAANLASRLEGANKYFGTKVLMSGTTHNALNGLIFSRKVAEITVVGKSEVIAIYEPYNTVSDEQMSSLEVFGSALNLYESGSLERALAAFREIPQDPVARVYMSRIERDIAKGVNDSWTHVWNLSEK
ncbi:MAG: adenylate/guanylate cyclase domain-containing protein [Deltaproteobacteria bacterium]|nr:adenylate/guanylate cyclase domain-containing protein [Deltaproteobacteria bacterium]